MIKVQAIPNTHPGGVHGALLRLLYHSLSAGLHPIKSPPNARAPKLTTKKNRVLKII